MEGHPFGGGEEVSAAFKRQLKYFTELAPKVNLEAERYQPQRIQFPLLSAFTKDCIERGLDITRGGARFEFTGVNLANLADAADGLAAIKALSSTFDRRALTLGETSGSHEDNLNLPPKFGGDEPEADKITAEIVRHYASVAGRHKTLRASPLMVYDFGPKTAALSNGRKAKEPLAMSACPSPR